MPRYFFHIHNCETTRDEQGIELADDGAARNKLLEALGDLIGEQIRQGIAIDPEHRIEVRDAAGRDVMTMRFGDIFGASGNGGT
jgi:hypothetical protein